MSVDIDVCAKAQELLNVHVAIFKNRLYDDRGALSNRIEGHELGLHVRGKAGVLVSTKVDRTRPLMHGGLDPVIAARDA